MPNSPLDTIPVKWRLIPIQLGVLVTLFLVPVWYRFPDAQPPFTGDYVIGFAITVPLLWTVFWWFVVGLPGFQVLRKDNLRAIWVIALLLLVVWMFVSSRWAYMREIRPELATGAALQFGLVALFVLCVVCAPPPPSWMLCVLAVGTVFHSLIGGLQVMMQASLGLEILGELVLDPQKSGVSVIQSGSTRWLRPYGLASHPNILAGYLVVGLLATSAFMLASRRRVRWVGTGAFLAILWVLFLSFSRSAWLGSIGGVLVFSVLAYPRLRERAVRRHVLLTLAITVFLGLGFVVRYHPLLLARVGSGNEHTEVRSVNERIELANAARTAIERYPMQGVGAGNFPWFARDYFFYETDLGMRGDNVHNVFLSVWAELGLLGLGLFAATAGVGVTIGLRRVQTQPDRIYRYVLLSGFPALVAIGMFDHYPWSMMHFQVLWWTLLAASFAPLPREL